MTKLRRHSLACCIALASFSSNAWAEQPPSFSNRAHFGSVSERVFPAGLSSDPLIVSQWHLDAPPTEVAGTGLLEALNSPRQLDSVVVAVVDTGILSSHSDMGTVLPGYDFVRNVVTANDGDGRDNDPTDPGDWVSQEDIDNGLFPDECAVSRSSWHGTAVTGMLAAKTDNSLGIAGAAPHVQILPVRVMGRCGGTVLDLIDGIRWAAGLEVAGAPINRNPAAVINLSLGYGGTCDSSMQNALREVRLEGVLVVTAIGNGALSLSEQPYSPASCQGVLTVAAADREGNFANYNNRGSAVDVLAPGGVPGAGLITLDDGGSQSARHDDLFQARYGSSIATPLVSATAALMVAANPLLQPNHIETLIADTSRAVGDASFCPTDSCGSGLLDAQLAVNAAATADARNLPADDEQYSSGGGGSAHPAWLLLLLLLHQRGVAKVTHLVQNSGGKLPRR